jgi:hypothetical protein
MSGGGNDTPKVSWCWRPFAAVNSSLRQFETVGGKFFVVIGNIVRVTSHKIRDHEMVGAQNKVWKGRPKTPPKSCGVDTDLQV